MTILNSGITLNPKMMINRHSLKRLAFALLVLLFLYSLHRNIIYTKSEPMKHISISRNISQINGTFWPKYINRTLNSTITTFKNTTDARSVNMNNYNETRINTTTSTSYTTTVLTEVLPERRPYLPNGYLAVFIFHTHHVVLAKLQLFLIRKLTLHLAAIEIFLDGLISDKWIQVANSSQAELHSLPSKLHKAQAGPSDRNADVVNWAVATRGKKYLGNGTAILLLDGDVFPLAYFDSATLLNSHDIVCRKHPAPYAWSCWIGFICIAPRLHHIIDEFSVSQSVPPSRGFDAGGQTYDYLTKYKDISFAWMKETILFRNDTNLFWGAINNDFVWIKTHFNPCDKCGPEIFFSPFDGSSAVFYHMISASSEWRFQNQVSRRKSIHDAIMRSPYGHDQTNTNEKKHFVSELEVSVKKIQQMPLIPLRGNLTCSSLCRG